jgi:Arylsulfotransferase (ASST)
MVRAVGAFIFAGCLVMVGASCQPKVEQGNGAGGASGSSGTGGSTSSSGKSGSGGDGARGGSSGAGGVATGGMAGSGGIGTGGNGGKGGTDATGGKSGVGGGAGSGGKGGSAAGGGGAGGGGGTGGASTCITQSVKISPNIATVGIVTWSTTVSGLSSAHIDFGLDTSYGMTAPVDKPSASSNTTLLLGMKQKRTYHYRITATGSSGDCSSDDHTIATGALPSGLPTITVTNTGDKSKQYGGFLVTGQYMSATGTSGSPAYILDADGDMVWAYNIGQSQVTCAKMSYDGTHMWINTANVGIGNKAYVHRVTMDGITDEDKSSTFAGMNHQLTVLPDETVAFYAYNDSTNCEDIKEYSPDGKVKTIVNSGTAMGGASACHLNNIQYAKDDDSLGNLVFSDLDNQVVVKVRRKDGSTVWVLNGGNKATLSGLTWNGSQHGIHILGVDRLLVFNNNLRNIPGSTTSAGGTGDGSVVLDIKLDLTNKTASKLWFYKASPGIQNDVMGDLQRLPNGNTVVAYSTKGVVQEVDAQGNLLSDWSFPLGAQFGYIEKRASLYGPPPR